MLTQPETALKPIPTHIATAPSLIVETTGNLKAAQLLLGHTKIESTARYLETELNAPLKISEKVEL